MLHHFVIMLIVSIAGSLRSNDVRNGCAQNAETHVGCMEHFLIVNKMRLHNVLSTPSVDGEKSFVRYGYSVQLKIFGIFQHVIG